MYEDENDVVITLDQYFWECECCGSGFHTVISITKNWLNETFTYSINDQFGGTLEKQHLEMSELVGANVYVEDFSSWVAGYAKAYQNLGLSVKVIEGYKK